MSGGLGGVRRFLSEGGDEEPGPDARLGEIAVGRGYCGEADLEAALAEQASADPRPLLGQVLVRRRALTSEQLLRILAFQRRPGAGERPPLPTGLSVGRFVLSEEIGRGDRSVVYRAAGPDNLPVALKVMKPEGSDEVEASRLLRAAERASAIRNPALLVPREWGLTAPPRGPARPYVVMELSAAPTLERCLADGGASRGFLLQVLEDAARALAAAGLPHGGFKASNLFVGRDGRARISDFGQARLPHPPSAVEPGALRRLAALAPEQVECRAWDLARSDVFALGCVLYEILAGRPPFEAATAAELFRVLSAAEPPPLRRWTPTVEPALEALCRRALSRDPDRRPAGAAEFADELARARGSGDKTAARILR
jgi:serine/threonine-protein kinase